MQHKLQIHAHAQVSKQIKHQMGDKGPGSYAQQSKQKQELFSQGEGIGVDCLFQPGADGMQVQLSQKIQQACRLKLCSTQSVLFLPGSGVQQVQDPDRAPAPHSPSTTST